MRRNETDGAMSDRGQYFNFEHASRGGEMKAR